MTEKIRLFLGVLLSASHGSSYLKDFFVFVLLEGYSGEKFSGISHPLE